MLRFAADENITRQLLAGLRRRIPDIDIVSVQEAGLSGADDPAVLAWAASEGRILLSHDLSTMVPVAYARVAEGLTMPGVFLFSDRVPVGAVIDDIADILGLSDDDEWSDGVHYLPL